MSSEEATAITTTLLTDMASLHFEASEQLVFSGNKADSWNFFFKRRSNYALLTRLDRKPREIQVAIFENCLGDVAMRIYQGILFDSPNSGCNVQDILQALSEYAVEIINETYKRFAFHQRKQEEGEAFDTFYNDLRVLSCICNFYSKCNDSMLRDQFVEDIRNQSTKQDLLKLQNLTLQNSVDICRAAEKASIHSQSMGTENAQVMKVYKTNRAKEPAQQKECLFFGYLHAPKRSRCPAYGKLCNACKEKDHFE